MREQLARRFGTSGRVVVDEAIEVTEEGLGVGVLGGFTTFSAVSVAAAQSEAAAALTIMLLSFATSIAAYLLGDTLRERRHG